MKAYSYIPDYEIAREAACLLQAFRASGGGLPYDLEAMIWDILNPTDRLALDNETELGCCSETGDKILGKTVLSERVIYIAPDLIGKPNYPFTLAHEIGHWVLHCRPQLNEGQMSMFDDQGPSSFQHLTFNRAVEAPDTCRDPLEIQANLFAAHLLMPECEVKSEFHLRFPDGVNRAQAENLKECSRRLARSCIGGNTPLHKAFGTSIEAMAIRLEALKLII